MLNAISSLMQTTIHPKRLLLRFVIMRWF